MFKTILTTEGGMTIPAVCTCLLVALVLGGVLSLVYVLSDSHKRYSLNFAVSLVILPAIVALVIMLVGSNVARAFSVAGAFTLIRFRSVPGNSRDITCIFFAMAIGLTSGVGYISLAAVITVVVGALYVALMRSPFATHKEGVKQLKITIPENLNYEGALDEVFDAYTRQCVLEKVKTTNLGALYELTYHIELKKGVSTKEFIDKLRCRNGNLNIALGMVPEKEMEL